MPLTRQQRWYLTGQSAATQPARMSCTSGLHYG